MCHTIGIGGVNNKDRGKKSSVEGRKLEGSVLEAKRRKYLEGY